MSDQVPHHEDLERTDVLPQLGFTPIDADEHDHGATSILAKTVAPFGTAAQADGGQIHALPAKPSTTDLAVGGIRGKIADLENRLLEAQDHQISLNRHCEQLNQRSRAAEERATKSEANYVVQSTELFRIGQRANEAEQRLVEQRVRFEAQLVDAERQVVELRTRTDKRTASLEQALADQTDRANQNDRSIAQVKLDADQFRSKLDVANEAIRSLEARLAEQTRTAADVSRSYAQQTAQVSATAELMTAHEKHIGSLKTEKDEVELKVDALQAQIRAANDNAAKLQGEIDMKLRHIAALESGLANRDRSITDLQTHRHDHEHAKDELLAARASLETKCASLEKTSADAQSALTATQQEVTRLTEALQRNDVRINELAASLRSAEQMVKERGDAVIAADVRERAANATVAQSSEQLAQLRQQLGRQTVDIDSLQSQLQARIAELQAARESQNESESRHKELLAERQTHAADMGELQKVMQRVMSERDQLDLENQAGRAELSRTQSRYDEAVQTIMAARETISVKDQQNASLERELRAATHRLVEANARIERAAAATESIELELRERDNRVAVLEQKLVEHASALSAIGQDIERVNASTPNDRLTAMGYALESLENPGVVHRLTRMTTTAGRAGSNDIAIDSTSVSRYHARIVVKPEGVWLIDLQSTNGCGVNGRRTARQIICDGDVVMIGHCKFRFSILGAENNRPEQNEAAPLLFDAPLLIGSPVKKDDENRASHH